MATRRKKLMYQIWDEDPRTLAAAVQGAQMGDPAAGQLIQELMQVAQYNAMVDKLGKSLEICWDYFCGAQAHGFKQEMKALVRRTKVNGVGYVKLCFQRALEPNPEITAEITDVTDKIARIEAQLTKAADGELDECDAQISKNCGYRSPISRTGNDIRSRRSGVRLAAVDRDHSDPNVRHSEDVGRRDVDCA
jgi:hypothetical protein